MFRPLALAALLFAAIPALASPADDARRHFQAIADSDVEALAASYSDGAIVEWVGGPLDGHYAGRDEIRKLWEKFSAANGKLELRVAGLDENANAKGATVTASARYRGKAQLKIRHAITMREGRIVAELWQIDPEMKFE